MGSKRRGLLQSLVPERDKDTAPVRNRIIYQLSPLGEKGRPTKFSEDKWHTEGKCANPDISRNNAGNTTHRIQQYPQNNGTLQHPKLMRPYHIKHNKLPRITLIAGVPCISEWGEIGRGVFPKICAFSDVAIRTNFMIWLDSASRVGDLVRESRKQEASRKSTKGSAENESL